MYNSIRGIFSGLELNGPIAKIYIDQAGLEWQIEVTRLAAASLPQLGTEVRIFTYLQHSEDQHCLYGFATKHERSVFLELLKVQGIGPRAALKILSGCTPQKLTELLESSDLKGLEKIPGLGTKTAQKLLLTLQGKLVLLPDSTLPKTTIADEDLVQALYEMGYDKKIVITTVQKLGEELGHLKGQARDQEILRRAIIAMS